MRCSLHQSATTTSCSLALVVLALSACGDQDPRPQVLVAASLHRAVTEVVDKLGLQVRVGTAASSTLARQIEHGANAAVFLSANREWMDYLAERKLVVADTRRRVVKNQLVWVAQSKKFLRERGSARRVAIGDPAHVPVGQYARAYLQQRGDGVLPSHRTAMEAIILCRTADIQAGGIYRCADCGHLHYAYRSCGNRHCPRCGHDKIEQWLQRQQQRLLPVKYFLVTFTLPHELHAVAYVLNLPRQSTT